MYAPTLRARSVGELLDAAFQMVRARYLALAFAGVVLESPALALYLVVPNTALGLVTVVDMLLLSFVTAATVVIVSNTYLGRSIDAGQVYRRVFSRFWAILGAAVIQTTAVLAGLIVCIAPGLVLMTSTFTMIAVVMLEDAGPRAAFERSCSLTAGNGWRVFGTLVVTVIILLVAQLGAELLAALLPAAGLAREAAVFIVMAAVSPFVTVVSTLVYYDLRIRKEGFDIQALVEAMDPTPVHEAPA